MILLFPSLIHLKTDEDKAYFKPRYVVCAGIRVPQIANWVYSCHMFYGQRVMDVPDGLPKWDGLTQESNLIEDSPPDMVRELERKREKEREERFKKGENK